MKVRHGWSGETSRNVWGKFDLELEEEDLRRLLSDAGFDDAVYSDLPLRTGFRLLEIEAECLVMAKLMARYGFPADEGRRKVAQLMGQKADLLNALRSTAGSELVTT